VSELTFGMRLTYDGKSANADMEETRARMERLTSTGGKMATQYSYIDSAMRKHVETNVQTASSVNKLLDRYDPLGAKLRQLQEDFKKLDSAAAGGQIGTGSDARVDQAYAAMQQQMVMLKNGTTASSTSMSSLGLNTQYARRELMQLGKEALTGDFSQMPRTFATLATHSNILPALISPIGLAIAGVTAAAVAGGAAWYYWGHEAESAADRAITASKRATEDMRASDAVYLLNREREQIAKKIPVQWLSYDEKDLKKLDDDSQKLIAEYRRLSKELKQETARSDASWDSLHSTPQEKHTSELQNLKQRFEEQKVIHKSNQQELLALEKQYQQKKAEIEKQYSKKANADQDKGDSIVNGLIADYDREIAKRQRDIQSPLLSAADKQHADNLALVGEKADRARESLDKLNLSKEEAKSKTAQINAGERDAIAAMEALRMQVEKNNASWEYGAAIAMRKYQDEAANTAALSERFFTSSFKSMEAQEVSFIRKGKADWRSFGDTIINELVRIQVAKANAQLIGTVAGWFSGGSGSGATSTGSDWNPDYSLGSATPRASGGPVAANSLYRVNEMGPELFHQDGSDYLMMGGRGGYVKPLGSEVGVNGGGNVFSIQVNVDAKSGDTQTQSNNDALAKLGNRIATVSRSVILEEMRPGGLLARAA